MFSTVVSRPEAIRAAQRARSVSAGLGPTGSMQIALSQSFATMQPPQRNRSTMQPVLSRLPRFR